MAERKAQREAAAAEREAARLAVEAERKAQREAAAAEREAARLAVEAERKAEQEAAARRRAALEAEAAEREAEREAVEKEHSQYGRELQKAARDTLAEEERTALTRRNALICEAYAAGMRPTVIGELVGLHRTVIHRIVRLGPK